MAWGRSPVLPRPIHGTKQDPPERSDKIPEVTLNEKLDSILTGCNDYSLVVAGIAILLPSCIVSLSDPERFRDRNRPQENSGKSGRSFPSSRLPENGEINQHVIVPGKIIRKTTQPEKSGEFS